MSKSKTIIYYLLLVLISLGFLSAGIPKITANPTAVAGFAQAHLPLWFVYFIGYAEILGAIGLWIPKLQRYAAYGLWIILAGAVVVTAIYQPIAMAFIPLVYAAVLFIIMRLKSQKA